MEAETQRLLHELKIHQIELDAQNAELLRLKDLAEHEAKKYLELYDSSPTGYLTLSSTGNILELNLAGAEMLGINRSDLKNSKFALFVSPATRNIFNLFIKNVFISLINETCVVILLLDGDKRVDVSLTGIVKADGANCFVTMVDISEHTRTLELLIANKELLFQNNEKAKRAAELIIANVELLYQNDEKAKRAAELIIANKELLFQNDEKAKQAEVLVDANRLIALQRDRLQEIACLVPGVVYQYRLRPDGSSCFPFASEAIRNIYNVSPEEVREDAGKVFANIHPDDYDKVVNSIQASANELSHWQHEYRVKFDDGTIRTLYGNALPQLEANGSVLWHGFITDITESKQVQQRLQDSEARYSSMISNITDVIAIMDADGLKKYESPNLKKIFGWLPEDNAGRSAFSFIHPDDMEYALKVFHSMLGEDRSVKTLEFRYECKDGSYKPVELTISNLLNDPLINGIMVSYRDISERKLAQESLYKSEARYSSMISNISDVIGIMGADGLMKYKSANIEKFFGWLPEDRVGTSGFSTVHPDDIPNVQNIFYSLLGEENSVKTLEFRYLCKNGSYKPIELTASNQLNNLEINGILLNYRDISTRKKAEDDLKLISTRLSFATFAGGIGIWDYNIHNNTIVWDDQMFALYGIEEHDFDGIYEAWRAGLHPDDAKRGDLEIQMAINGEKEFDTDFRVVWPDQSVHSIKATALVTRDESGKALSMIGTNWDITEQKKNEEKLLKARNEAEAANKSKSIFLANMSHEIRTPLNAIIGFSQLLNREQLSDRQNEYSVSIHRSGEHLLKLLNDILELSRIESGYGILNPVNSDLFALFADIRMMFSQQAQSKRVQLTFETSDNLPQYILVDDNKLRQILINLIGNAMKFTDKGRISVRAGLDRTHVIKSMLTIEVQDSGAGISEHEIGNLFRQFEQASEGIKQNNGTGLGLALSRELAILMGGNITVASKEGEGSVFTIRVEIKEGKPEVGEEPISKRVIGIVNPKDTYRILVVDDKEENLKIVVDFLHWAGFETQEAENGEKAIARFEQWNPHLILMDIRMPVMDGYEAIRRIRSSEKGKHTPMIVLTAGQPEVDGARFTELNIQSYIRKPFRESELFDTIGKILGIQYIYEEDFIFGASSRHLNSPENVAEDLAKLPEKLIAQMKDAIGKADFYLLIELIKQFESDNPELAKHLLIYANNFDYGYLNQIMKKEGGQ